MNKVESHQSESDSKEEVQFELGDDIVKKFDQLMKVAHISDDESNHSSS